MEKIVIILCVVTASFLAVHSVYGETAYQVTFVTEECNGDSGMATVAIDQVYKVQSAGCSDSQGRQMKQLLVHNASGSYDAYSLSTEEADAVMKEIKGYMTARRNLLERSEAIIVKP